MLLCGDVMLGRSFNRLFGTDPNFNIWGSTLDLITKCDFFGINLETTITNHTIKFPNKTFNFRLGTRYKNVLNNVSYANLANNHSLDFMEAGLTDTMENLNSLNIAFSGAGKTLSDAMKAAIININGTKIGIVSASDHPKNFAAGKENPGINFVDIDDLDRWKDYITSITAVRSKVDILIYSMHHGSNYVDAIPQNTINFFRNLVDSGVDIIHGHSAHHVLPIEKYKNGYIFYAMGDFIDDYAVDPFYRNDLSFLAEIKISDKKIKSVDIHPTKITIGYNNGNGVLVPQVNLIDKRDPDYDFVVEHIMYNKYKKKYRKYKHKYLFLKNNSFL